MCPAEREWGPTGVMRVEPCGLGAGAITTFGIGIGTAAMFTNRLAQMRPNCFK